MALNIFWTCEVCGSQVPGDRVSCPNCQSKQKSSVRNLAADAATPESPLPASPAGAQRQPGRAVTAIEPARRFLEIHEWAVEQEQNGRRRMASARVYGVVFGIPAMLLPLPLLPASTETYVVCLIVGAIVGAGMYQWRYDGGLRTVLDAQKNLVAVATEQSTREALEILKQIKSGGFSAGTN